MVSIDRGNAWAHVRGAPSWLLQCLARHLAVPIEPAAAGGVRFSSTFVHDEQFWGSLVWEDRIPAGLTARAQAIAQHYGVTCTIRDVRVRPSQGYPWHSLTGVAWRPYQERAHAAAVLHGSGVVVAPPRAGKTLLQARLLDVLALPAIVLAPTVAIVAQTYTRFAEIWGADLVSRLDGSAQPSERDPARPIVVSTIPSALALSPEWWQTRQVLIYDEVHHCLGPDAVVLTRSGGLRISLIRAGDYVIAASGRVRRVLRVWKREGPIKWLRVATARSTLKVTALHQVYTNFGKRPAYHLRAGDLLFYPGPGRHLESCPIQEITEIDAESSTVFDLEIEGEHNYFADGVLVSNSAADTWHAINQRADHIYHRYGYTGTHYRSGDDALAMHAVLGEVIADIPLDELIAAGYLAVPRVLWVNHSRGLPRPKLPTNNFEAIYKAGIAEYEPRNAAVINIASALRDHGEATIILTRRRAHADLLGSAIEGSVVVKGGEGPQTVGAIRDFLAGRYSVLIGTTVIGEGVDLPRASALVYAAGGNGGVQMMQSYFRPLTGHAGKRIGRIYDLWDSHAEMLRKQSESRMQFARAQLGMRYVHAT